MRSLVAGKAAPQKDIFSSWLMDRKKFSLYYLRARGGKHCEPVEMIAQRWLDRVPKGNFTQLAQRTRKKEVIVQTATP